jgi:hypothetical protein
VFARADQADDTIERLAALIVVEQVQLVDGTATVAIADAVTGEQFYAGAGKHKRLLTSFAEKRLRHRVLLDDRSAEEATPSSIRS